MGVKTSRVTVTNVPTLLATTNRRSVSVVVKNKGDSAVYLGNSAVTSATGIQLDPNESFSAQLADGENLYGIVEDSSPVHSEVVHVFGNRKA